MSVHAASAPSAPRQRQRVAVLAAIALVASATVLATLVLPGWLAEDPRVAAHRSLVGTWARGAPVRPAGADAADPYRLASLREVAITADGRSTAELALTLGWSDGRTQRAVGCTDMLPGYVRLDDPVLGPLTIATAADGAVSIDDGRRAFSLERR